MSTDILPFQFESQQVRVIEVDSEPWFVASDIAKVLGYRDAERLTRRLDEDEKGTRQVGTPGGTQTVSVINEAGLYSSIFGSKSDAATPFKRWVTHEVLPSIRKRGGYVDPAATQHQINALFYDHMRQVELLQAAKGLVHADFLEAKARIIIARGMGEKPELDPATRPLTVQEYLKERGVSGKKLASTSPTFGKRLKAAYYLEHDRDPERTAITLTSGRIITPYGYTESDRPLMDHVWETYYAKEVVA